MAGADGVAVVECRSNLWVHVDGEVSLLHHLFMPFYNMLFDPVGEWLADTGVDDVCNPLSWQRLQGSFIWQEEIDSRMSQQELEHLLDLQ